ncbi:MAG: type II toxin-antitoxin system prevent-host-death family antitoxin [Alphaproteobacteria bacterium]|nr:type II toxin-antitoxin system prevent-host-death family antitoxin [Alphaproteobacteria bacterium]
MRTLKIHAAKTNLSRLINEVEAGEEIVITRGDRPVARHHPHRDPFDRMLIAQALIDDMTLVSNERLFDGFGVRRIW